MIQAMRTADVRPTWAEYGNRGDTLHVSPDEGRAYYMEADDRATVWLFTAPTPLPETLAEARAMVTDA